MEFITYDYKTINIKKENKYRILDAAEAFGYEIVEVKEVMSTIELSLKRDSDIKCKDELDHKFDEVLKLINEMSISESRKKSRAVSFALTLGIIGLLTFGGGMSAVMIGDGTWPFMVGGIVLGIIGVIIMLITDSVYKLVLQKSISKYEPIIEEDNKKVNLLLKEANELLKSSLE